MRQSIEIATRWGKLFSIKYLHDYYHDGVGSNFQYVPSEETRQVMRNLRLVVREHQGGIVVLFDGDSALERLNNHAALPEKLIFYIQNNSKYFSNFSDISFDNSGKSYYFSNNLEESTKDTLLHKHNYITQEPDIDLYTRFQSIFLKFEKPKAFSEIQVLDVMGNPVNTESAVSKLSRDEKFKEHRISLRNLSEGKYSVSIKGEKQPRQFYLKDTSTQQIWGVIDIYLKPQQKAYQLFNQKEFLKPTYSLRVGARDTHWKYILVAQKGNKDIAFSDAKVTYNSEDVAFTKPDKIRLKNGQSAFSIESKTPIKLKEVRSQTDRLELKLKNGSKWMPRAVKLPKPDISMIKPDEKSSKLYSTAYIYV
ncbi:MAG: hypothetical protein ACI85O_000344 [Saprospiraceae bacterium]|jgi:hypothetical protein